MQCKNCIGWVKASIGFVDCSPLSIPPLSTRPSTRCSIESLNFSHRLFANLFEQNGSRKAESIIELMDMVKLKGFHCKGIFLAGRGGVAAQSTKLLQLIEL